MWWVILMVIVTVVSAVLVVRAMLKESCWYVAEYVGASILVLFAGVLLTSAGLTSIVPMTTGWGPGYANGTCTGYVVDVSQRGLIWRTCEIEMLVSTDGAVMRSESLTLSTPDIPIAADFKRHLTQSGRVEYTGWIIPNWSNGWSHRVVDKVTWNEK